MTIIQMEIRCTKWQLIVKIEMWKTDCVLLCVTWQPVHASEPFLGKGYMSFWNSGLLGYILVQW